MQSLIQRPAASAQWNSKISLLTCDSNINTNILHSVIFLDIEMEKTGYEQPVLCYTCVCVNMIQHDNLDNLWVNHTDAVWTNKWIFPPISQ